MKVSRIASVLVASAVLSAPVYAGSVSAPMSVSVRVIARAIVTVNGQQTVNVTASDLARGYVDVAAPLIVHGRTNSRNGYLLQVEKTSEDFNAVDLEFPNATMSVASHESWIQRPYVPGGEVVAVTARLFLAPGASAGPHALPISFSASPL